MKKTRIFIAFLMVVTMLAFTGCARDNGTDGVPNDGVKGTTGGGVVNNVERGVDDLGDDIRNGVDNMDGNGTVNNNDNDMNNTTGPAMNSNLNDVAK